MTFQEMADEFYVLIDKPYTGFFQPESLISIFNHAQTNVVERIYDKFQLEQGVPDELSGLVFNETLTVNDTRVNLSTNLTHTYRHYLAGEVTYDVNGKSYKAVPYVPTEGMRFVKDPFDSPDITQPFLRIYEDPVARNEVVAYFYPQDTDVQTFEIAYLREPDPINIEDDTTEPLYNLKMQRYVILEAANVAGYTLRDNNLYKATQQEIVENP